MSAPAVDRAASGASWREAGDGPPILFLHGLGGTRLAWEPQLEGLSDRFRCIAWDMPGYGQAAPLPQLTFPLIADSIVALLDLAGVERAHIVGLSFGGQQAMHLAIRHPGRVDRLVLADTSPRFGANGTDPGEWKRARLAPIEAGLTPADMAPHVVDAIAAPGFAGRERDRVIAAFAPISSSAFRAAVECLPTHDVSDRLGEIASPTLVIVGELDEETPVEYAELIAGAIPGAELSVIPGVGHLAPSEAPETFNQLVRSFIGAT
jgi:pimeloyl-ACP methyl ester carboxylesterase